MRLRVSSAVFTASVLALSSAVPAQARAAPPGDSAQSPAPASSAKAGADPAEGQAGEADPGPAGPVLVPDAEAEALIDSAIQAWRSGQWTEVRDLLEPLVREDERIEDPLLREQALRYLAEATLYDPGLDSQEREGLARGYIERILERSSAWTPPSGLHGRAFYDLSAKTKAEIDSQTASACQGQLLTCEADLTELESDHRGIQGDYGTLREAFDAQLVERTQVIQRNRGIALIPFGVGHFTSDRLWLGGLFLGLEAATGAAGLGLILTRNTVYGCQRTAGFQPGSLVCTIEESNDGDTSDAELARIQSEIKTIRDVEQAMGIAFLSLVVLDIALGQALFKSFDVVRVDEVPRNELTSPQTGSAPGTPAPGSAGQTEGDGGDAGAAPPRPMAPQPSAKLRLRPSPVFFAGPGGLPAGGGLGLTFEF